MTALLLAAMIAACQVGEIQSTPMPRSNYQHISENIIDSLPTLKIECDTDWYDGKPIITTRYPGPDTNWLMQTTVFHGTTMPPESTLAYWDSVKYDKQVTDLTDVCLRYGKKQAITYGILGLVVGFICGVLVGVVELRRP